MREIIIQNNLKTIRFIELMDDPFHAEMRKRMKQNYYLKEGKEKQQIRKYMSYYNLAETFFNGDETLTQKVEKLKKYVADERQKKREIVCQSLN